MLTNIWITPPLAISRVGSSATPCAAFSWSNSEISPSGTARTTLLPEETLSLDADGNVNAMKPDSIVFKDADGAFLPVCPFFELHGSWLVNEQQRTGPITKSVLSELGLVLSDVVWSVKVANLKAYHFTLDDGDRIQAEVTISADDTTLKTLDGHTLPATGVAPLISAQSPMPMGAVQLARATDDESFPELRLRFYAPPGVTYGPTDLADRISRSQDPRLSDPSGNRPHPNADWEAFDLLPERKIVNPLARWSTLNLDEEGPPPVGAGDPRNSPGSLSASLIEVLGTPPDLRSARISMGLVDDVSDGIVSCRIGQLEAHARIAVGPPDFAPMNRPFTSLQDGLSDRESRENFRQDLPPDDELEQIVADIFERALETSMLMNKDAQNDRARATNFDPNDPSTDLPSPSQEFEDNPGGSLWAPNNPAVTARPTPWDAMQVDELPVTFKGLRKHRRYNAIEFLRDRLREEPDLIEKWIRIPRDPSNFFDRRMPALMRGSDGQAMHLTRRQYEMIRLWASRQSAGGGAIT